MRFSWLLVLFMFTACGQEFSSRFREAGTYAYHVTDSPGYTPRERTDAILRAKAAASSQAEQRAVRVLENELLASNNATADPDWAQKQNHPTVAGWFRVADVCRTQAMLLFERKDAEWAKIGSLRIQRNGNQCQAEFDKMQARPKI